MAQPWPHRTQGDVWWRGRGHRKRQQFQPVVTKTSSFLNPQQAHCQGPSPRVSGQTPAVSTLQDRCLPLPAAPALQNRTWSLHRPAHSLHTFFPAPSFWFLLFPLEGGNDIRHLQSEEDSQNCRKRRTVISKAEFCKGAKPNDYRFSIISGGLALKLQKMTLTITTKNKQWWQRHLRSQCGEWGAGC